MEHNHTRRRRVSGVYEIRADGPTRKRRRAQTPETAGSSPAQRTARLPRYLAAVLDLFARTDHDATD